MGMGLNPCLGVVEHNRTEEHESVLAMGPVHRAVYVILSRWDKHPALVGWEPIIEATSFLLDDAPMTPAIMRSLLLAQSEREAMLALDHFQLNLTSLTTDGWREAISVADACVRLVTEIDGPKVWKHVLASGRIK